MDESPATLLSLGISSITLSLPSDWSIRCFWRSSLWSLPALTALMFVSSPMDRPARGKPTPWRSAVYSNHFLLFPVNHPLTLRVCVCVFSGRGRRPWHQPASAAPVVLGGDGESSRLGVQHQRQHGGDLQRDAAVSHMFHLSAAIGRIINSLAQASQRCTVGNVGTRF